MKDYLQLNNCALGDLNSLVAPSLDARPELPRVKAIEASYTVHLLLIRKGHRYNILRSM
jgi:hypothetical protein